MITEQVSDCESSPCVHGQCINTVNGYTCDCDIGYRGENCDGIFIALLF